MSIFSKIVKSVFSKNKLEEAKNEVVDVFVTATLGEFAKAVQENKLAIVLNSLYVDINYAKDIMSKDPIKAAIKLKYILAELEEACKLLHK